MSTKTKSQSSSTKWEQELDVYTGDDVINAYFKGKQDQKDEMQRIYFSKFETNLEKSQRISEKLYNAISEKGFKVHSIHLKADSVTKFSALFLIDKDDFIKEEFRDAFIIARAFKKETEDSTFSIAFNFTHNGNTIDEKCLSSDGFFTRFYGQK